MAPPTTPSRTQLLVSVVSRSVCVVRLVRCMRVLMCVCIGREALARAARALCWRSVCRCPGTPPRPAWARTCTCVRVCALRAWWCVTALGPAGSGRWLSQAACLQACVRTVPVVHQPSWEAAPALATPAGPRLPQKLPGPTRMDPNLRKPHASQSRQSMPLLAWSAGSSRAPHAQVGLSLVSADR